MHTHRCTHVHTHTHTHSLKLSLYLLSRKRKAKKSRETRKKTQPVPSDLLEQLSQFDNKEVSERGSEEGKGVSGKVDVVKEEVERGRQEYVEQLQTEARDATVMHELNEMCCWSGYLSPSTPSFPFLPLFPPPPPPPQPVSANSPSKQSAYRPSARPVPRLHPADITSSPKVPWNASSQDSSLCESFIRVDIVWASRTTKWRGRSVQPHIYNMGT